MRNLKLKNIMYHNIILRIELISKDDPKIKKMNKKLF